jgi:hypothetical protein
MKLKNVNFEQWLKNHSPDHNDKWCRELYPFNIFRLIHFDDTLIYKEQKIYLNSILYYVTLTKIELQDNGRYRTSFDLSTFPNSKTQEWKQRKWNTIFQIVYSKKLEFITVFTKKEDPSKDYVIRFMKGNFEKINKEKSIPISELLIKTLILHMVELAFPSGKHNQEFEFKRQGVNERPEHPQFIRDKIDRFTPIYSIRRDLWICYSFTEEKAHRIAFYNANQCQKLIVIYCNPSYTRHQRCNYEGTEIISIYELSNIVSSEIRNKYEDQIRFLQNHLNLLEKINIDELLEEINQPKLEEYEIQKSDLMEAFGTMKIFPKSEMDFFHSLCCINLINAYLSRKRKGRQILEKDKELFKNMYSFKSYLADILTLRIKSGNISAPIYIQNDLVIVESYGFQFSFHSISINETLENFSRSTENRLIEWSGKRLQPIAPLILKYSRGIRQKYLLSE